VSGSVPITLAGAYHPEGRPLDQRALTVELALPRTFPRAEIAVNGTVDAEDVATRAHVDGVVRLIERPPSVSAELGFKGDDGQSYVLSFGSDVTRIDMRSLTELTGTITRVPATATAVGVVRLRLDWRTALFGSA
jgi:hypothetical protein